VRERNKRTSALVVNAVAQLQPNCYIVEADAFFLVRAANLYSSEGRQDINTLNRDIDDSTFGSRIPKVKERLFGQRPEPNGLADWAIVPEHKLERSLPQSDLATEASSVIDPGNSLNVDLLVERRAAEVN